MSLFNVETELVGYTVHYREKRKVVFIDKILMHYKCCFSNRKGYFWKMEHITAKETMFQWNMGSRAQIWTVLHVQCFLTAAWQADLPDSLGSVGNNSSFLSSSYQITARIHHFQKIYHYLEGWAQSACVCSMTHWVVLQLLQAENTRALTGLGYTSWQIAEKQPEIRTVLVKPGCLAKLQRNQDDNLKNLIQTEIKIKKKKVPSCKMTSI